MIRLHPPPSPAQKPLQRLPHEYHHVPTREKLFAAAALPGHSPLAELDLRQLVLRLRPHDSGEVTVVVVVSVVGGML